MTRLSQIPLALLLAAALGTPRAALAQEQRPSLELSLQDAVKRALENNVDIAVAKYTPESSAFSVRQLEGLYDPFLTGGITKRSQSSPATNTFAGAGKVTTKTDIFNFGLSQEFMTGAGVSLTFNNNKQDTNNVFSTFNPAFNSSLTANLTQPLLRNFRIDSNRQQLKVARKNKEISDVQFHQTVVNTIASVKQSYYELLAAIDNLDAQNKSLALAKKLLEENQIKVRVGTMAPLDVVEAESEVAGREENVIVAEAAVLEAEDVIKRAIFPKNDPVTWALRIVPVDRPTAEPMPVDVESAIKNALEHRTDVLATRKSLESAEISVDYARNQVLPAVDFVASYGATGLGGTQLIDLATRQPLATPIPGGYGDAASQVFGRDFPTWTIGVNVAIPILNRQASASSARARVARDQTQASLRRLELQVASEVRSAARAVETNYKRVESTRAARVLQERRLDAEQKKFAAGMSTNFFVTQAQRDLAVAEVGQLRAIAEYRKSQVSFERVQEAGGGSVSFAGTGP